MGTKSDHPTRYNLSRQTLTKCTLGVLLSTRRSFNNRNTILVNGNANTTNFLHGANSKLSASPIFPPLKKTRGTILFISLTIGHVFGLSRRGPIDIGADNCFGLPPIQYNTGTYLRHVFRRIKGRRARVSLIGQRYFQRIRSNTRKSLVTLYRNTMVTSGAIDHAIFARTRVGVQSTKSNLYGMTFRTLRIAYLNRCEGLVWLITRVIPYLPHFLSNNPRIFVTLLLRQGGLIFLLRLHVTIRANYRRRRGYVRTRRGSRGHATRRGVTLRCTTNLRH